MRLPLFGLRKGLANLFSLSAHNQIVRRLNALTQMTVRFGGAAPELKVSDHNAVLTLPETSRSGAGSELQAFRVKSASALYLTCRTWDGANDGNTDVLVAKNFECRQPSSETLGGDTFSYTYSGSVDSFNGIREATNGVDITEQQCCIPLWEENFIIAAAMINSTGVIVSDVELSWIEVSSRAWARIG